MSLHTWVCSLFYSGGWQTVPAADVMNAAKITSQRGYAVDGEMRPSKITWRFNSGAVGNPYDPDSPNSAFYGLGGRYMPASVAVDGVTDAVCEAASWSPGRTQDYVQGSGRGVRYVDLLAQGVLRRIGQWSRQLRSPMRQWISGYGNLRGYWPLEDGTAATQFTNAWASGLPGYNRGGVTLQGATGPPGSDKVITLAAGAVFGGTFGAMSTSAGWQLFLSFNAAAATLSATKTPFLRWKSSNGYTWTFGATSTAYTIDVVDTDGTVVLTNSVLFGAGAGPLQWVTMRFKTSIAAGTVSVEQAWYTTGNLTFGTTWTFAGTLGRLTSWYQGDTASLALAHVGALTGLSDDLTSYNFQSAFNGYAGERSADRFARLCTQEGISYAILGNASDTRQMGPQKVDTLYNQFKECMATDDAMIYDARTAARLTYRTRVFTYTNAVQLALTYPAQLGWPFEKVLDDQALANVVTVSQRDGGDATSAVTTGPLAPNANGLWPGIGEIKKTVEVNVYAESDLQTLADWYLSKYAQPAARYATVIVDCDVSPSQGATAAALDPGDKITISGFAPDLITLKVIAIETETERGRRTVTLTCVPGDIWTPGVYDAATSRYDSGTTTLGVARDAVQTAWTFSTTDRNDCWDTAATPYGVLCGGELVTVTAMGAVTGTGPYTQAATVTRSVNGVVKAQTAGSEIHVATPGRYAL